MLARVFRGNGWSGAEYDALIEGMELGGRSAPGVLYHWAAQTADGVIAVDVYESRQAADTLAAERIGPLAAQLGLTPPSVEEYEVRNVLTP
jgi:hypothetical protein